MFLKQLQTLFCAKNNSKTLFSCVKRNLITFEANYYTMSNFKQFGGRVTAEQMERIKAIRAEKGFNSDIAVFIDLLENQQESQKIEVEKIVEVEKTLTENQFLVDFDSENAALIQQVCTELKIPGTDKREQFHALTEKALIFYIQEKYTK